MSQKYSDAKQITLISYAICLFKKYHSEYYVGKPFCIITLCNRFGILEIIFF